MSESLPTNHKEIIALIKRISGQANFIGAPRLFIDLFDGDIVTAVWFNQAVYWDGKTSEPIGFYKTAEEWKAEIGLSKFQSRRAGRICEERGLVSILFKKVYGTPKNHYLVIWPELLRQIKKTLENTELSQSETSQSETSIVNIPDIPQTETSEVTQTATSKDIPQTETSLINQEIPSKNEEEEEEIILPNIDITPRALLENLGLVFDPKEFGRISIYKRDEPLPGAFVLGWIAKAHLDRKRLRSPIAFIRSRLNGTELPDLYYLESFPEILPEEYLEKLELAAYTCPNCSKVFKVRRDLESHWMAEHDSEDPEGSPLPPSCKDPEAQRAWESVVSQLAMDMPRASFDSWVKTTHPVVIEEESLKVWVPTSYAREWLESRLASTVDRLLIGILARPVSVEFFTGSGDAVPS